MRNKIIEAVRLECPEIASDISALPVEKFNIVFAYLFNSVGIKPIENIQFKLNGGILSTVETFDFDSFYSNIDLEGLQFDKVINLIKNPKINGIRNMEIWMDVISHCHYLVEQLLPLKQKIEIHFVNHFSQEHTFFIDSAIERLELFGMIPDRDYRNVADEFKHLSNAEIKEELKRRSLPFGVLMMHWKGDFNIGTLIRNANSFGAREIFYVGKRRYDKRLSVGTHHYHDLIHYSSNEDILKLKEKYVLIGADNNCNSVPIETFEWPENALMIFGEEQMGIPEEVLKMCDHVVSITQFGSARSLNAANASAIFLYDYSVKIRIQK